MAGYITYFGLDDWYDGLTVAEQTALEQIIPGLLTESYEKNIKGHPGIYATLSTNLSAPPGIIKNRNFDESRMHTLANLLERNLDNIALLNPYRNGDHNFQQREFNYYKWGTADILTKIYAKTFIGTKISLFFTLRCCCLNTKRTQ